MFQFKKILVFLDYTDLDEILIQYAQALNNSLQADSLLFVHIYHQQHSNIFFGKAKDSSKSESTDALNTEFKHKLQNHLSASGFNWDTEIMEGDTNETILKAVKNHNADLVIMGRKQSLKGSDGLPKKIVNRSECSVLLIPEAPYRKITNILVPVDFSQFSAVAIKLSLTILGQSGKVNCQHVYFVPSGYHKTGKDYNEFAKVMEINAIKDTKEFIKKYKLPKERLEFTYTLDDNRDPADKIIGYGKRINTELILMGSKGRTEAASILLGSVAENVVNCNDFFPLLVLKKKNENLGFFDVILRM
jgi:nucleotide-binding universal stress UspA family protein